MGGLFGSKSTPTPKPEVKRLPVETDPEIQSAVSRGKKAAIQRTGRQSTLLDQVAPGTTTQKSAVYG